MMEKIVYTLSSASHNSSQFAPRKILKWCQTTIHVLTANAVQHFLPTYIQHDVRQYTLEYMSPVSNTHLTSHLLLLS